MYLSPDSNIRILISSDSKEAIFDLVDFSRDYCCTVFLESRVIKDFA